MRWIVSSTGSSRLRGPVTWTLDILMITGDVPGAMHAMCWRTNRPQVVVLEAVDLPGCGRGLQDDPGGLVTRSLLRRRLALPGGVPQSAPARLVRLLDLAAGMLEPAARLFPLGVELVPDDLLDAEDLCKRVLLHADATRPRGHASHSGSRIHMNGGRATEV